MLGRRPTDRSYQFPDGLHGPLRAGAVPIRPSESFDRARAAGSGRPRTPCRRRSRAGSSDRTSTGDRRHVLPAGCVQVVPGSSWGTFTIACTIPIALFVGLYMYRIRKGRVVEASLIGGVLACSAATVAGNWIPGSPLEPYFSLDHASRPSSPCASTASSPRCCRCGCCSCPRDYLSSFLKIGTIALLVVGVIVANPTLQAPAGQRGVRQRRADVPGQHLPVRVHLHHVRGDLGLPRAGLVRHDAEDDRQGERTSA